MLTELGFNKYSAISGKALRAMAQDLFHKKFKKVTDATDIPTIIEAVKNKRLAALRRYAIAGARRPTNIMEKQSAVDINKLRGLSEAVWKPQLERVMKTTMKASPHSRLNKARLGALKDYARASGLRSFDFERSLGIG